jgi:hypothetical protein
MNPEARKAANAEHVSSKLFRGRVDYRWEPDGNLTCYLTMTFAGGHAWRWSFSANPKEWLPILERHVRAKNPEVGFLGLDKLWKGAKKLAKGIATSGVFKLAGKALSAIAPALGPLGMAAKAAVGATRVLLGANNLAKKGNTKGAKALVAHAAKISAAAPVKTPTPSNPNPTLDVAHNAARKIYRLQLVAA